MLDWGVLLDFWQANANYTVAGCFKLDAGWNFGM